ncbi:MAG: DNA adenine methylase [Lachnospiraceae bacterium]|nr:DNA adenine methylase [Lachnospiraceae bacterium]
MSKQKVTFRIEEGEIELLKEKFYTDNQSEAIRLAIMQSLVTEDSEKLKTLFPYIGKKPPRIGREVVNAFEQSGCEIFVDLFCGSLAMLCYLSWDTKVMVNDINGNLTNLYKVIRDSPSDFVSEVMKLPYSEVVFKRFKEDLKSIDNISELDRAVAYFYVSFGAYRGRIDNPLFHISTTANTNRAEDYHKSIQWILQLSKRLQSVEILNRDFRKVLKSYNAEDVFIYADCPYLGTEDYYENVFSMEDHKDLADMLKSHKGKFVLSSKAKKELRKLYRSNNHYILNFEATYRLPDKRHREQLIMNFKMIHVNKYEEDDIKPYR